MGDYDRSSKWMIQHHGVALLRLAGISGIRSWRALQAEVVQPGQLPDGLLEAELDGADGPGLFVLELATYPEQRVIRQLVRDGLLVFLDRDRLPEIITFVLHPKGQWEVPQFHTMQSPLGWTELQMHWRVVTLWSLRAEDLLATRDPGLIPWVPLTRFDGPPELVLQRCREIIDQQASPDEHVNLLAVTQVLARLR